MNLYSNVLRHEETEREKRAERLFISAVRGEGGER
jgi:hypothetical protein